MKSSQHTNKLHAAVQRFRAVGCWGLAESLEKTLVTLQIPAPRAPSCSLCGSTEECFEARTGERVCYSCAQAEYEQALEDAAADLGDMDRKAALEEELAS